MLDVCRCDCHEQNIVIFCDCNCCVLASIEYLKDGVIDLVKLQTYEMKENGFLKDVKSTEFDEKES